MNMKQWNEMEYDKWTLDIITTNRISNKNETFYDDINCEDLTYLQWILTKHIIVEIAKNKIGLTLIRIMIMDILQK